MQYNANFWKTLGNFLKTELAKKGNWDQITANLGFARETLARLYREPEKRKLEIIARVAEYLEMPLSQLFSVAEKNIADKKRP